VGTPNSTSNFNPIAGQPVYTGTAMHTSAQNIPIKIFWGTRKITPNLLWWGMPPVSGPGNLGLQVVLPYGFQSNSSLIVPAVPNAAQAFFGKLHVQQSGGGWTPYGDLPNQNGTDAFADTKGKWFVPCIFGLGEGPVTAVAAGWDGQTPVNTLAPFNVFYELLPGTSTDSIWEWFSIFDPSSAFWIPANGRITYRFTACIAAYFVDCSNNNNFPSLPQQSFRCQRWPNSFYSLPATGDYSPADFIPDFLTSLQYGMLMPSAMLDSVSLAQFAAYVFCQQLYFSPLLDGQDKATDIIDRWAMISNAWIFWGGTAIYFVPLGDVALPTFNTLTFTPDLTPAYNLGVGDFLDADKPVVVNRADPADCYNRLNIQICSSVTGAGFESYAVEYKDQTLIDQYGLRDAPNVQGDDITDIGIGQTVVNLIGKRLSYIRNTYSFTLSYRYIRLLPGSIVTLTEPNIGLVAVPVRIRTIEIGEDFKLAIEAEEMTGTTGIATPQGSQAPSTGTINQQEVPGNINTPAILEPSSALVGPTPQVWVAATGGANWGGCLVYLSIDNVN
jgi:hypothetical protein